MFAAIPALASGAKSARAASGETCDGIFNGKPFWFALEMVASQTGNRIALGDNGRRIALEPRGKSIEISSVHGAFRTVAKQVVGRFPLETGMASHEVQLDVHWEPRFPVFRLDSSPKIAAVVSATKVSDNVDGSAVTLLRTPSRVDLKTIDDVRVEMARVYRDMRGGRIDPADGTKLAYVLSMIGKLIESGEIEKRLEALEGVLTSRKVRK